jgi:transposase InsO family protein
MRGKRESAKPLPGGAKPARAGGAKPGSGGEVRGGRTGAGTTHHSYTLAQKRALLQAYASSGLLMGEFCRKHGLSTGTLCAWRRRYGMHGDAGLENLPNPRNTGGRSRQYTPEERRQAVEAFFKSGMRRVAFARTWGVTPKTLQRWLAVWEKEGPKALETKPRGRPKGSGAGSQLPQAVQAEIVRTKRRFPTFGLRKVRDYLRRFRGVKVSSNSVGKVLREADVEKGQPPKKRPKRKKQPPRRFERSRPGELWQSDITSFVLRRHGRRVYLTAFLDDYSRYIVSWALELHQRSELVIGALLEGIARYGKPREVLTDQGRQYHVWRGKSKFERLLEREGISPVLSRTHHPQTLGKTERFWETVNSEFWVRAKPEELSDARERLGHFIAHYNFFRPHQGIDGLVPADRFFGAQDVLRKSLEERLGANELALALKETPRRAVYLCGQVGEQAVSLHGERGRLVFQTDDGVVKEMKLEELGAPQAKEERDGGEAGVRERDGDSQKTPSVPQEEALQDAAPGDPGAGPLAGGEPGGEGPGAPGGDGDPGDVAWADEAGGGGGAPFGAGLESVAALPAGAEWYGGGASEATPIPQEVQGDGRDAPRREGEGSSDRRAGEGARRSQALDQGLARATGESAGESDAEEGDGAAGGEGDCVPGKKEGQAAFPAPSGIAWRG